jgi:hypothetical protein
LKPKYQYCIEVNLHGRGWYRLFGKQDGSLEYMRGRFAEIREGSGPRSAYRLVRVNPSDEQAEPKVLDELGELSTLSLGMQVSGGYKWFVHAKGCVDALRKASFDVRRDPDAHPDHAEKFLTLASEVEALLK